jgi:hypothetical protein
MRFLGMPAWRMRITARPCHAKHSPETDCMAGHVRFELRNVIANYRSESSRGFPRSFGHHGSLLGL